MTSHLKLRAAGIAFAALLASGLAASAQDPVPAPAAPADPDKVVATVGGSPITALDLAIAQEDFAEELAKVPAPERPKAVLTVLIDIKMMAEAAAKDGLDKGDEFTHRLALLRERALRNEYFRVHIDQAVTEDQVKARYDAEIAKITPQDEIRASHILVETEDEAKAIIAELDKGADFATLAKEKSKDPGSGQMGGDLGFFAKGRMVPEFEQAAFALEVGKYTETPVKSQFGWHVIKLVDKRKQPMPPFEQVKEQVRQLVMGEAFSAAVKTLRDDTPVEILDDSLKPAAAPAEAPKP
ncbi:peptidylprolyl isomerase [Prosthecomicrobium pneumaticum]|uniref:Parvulin-like PPIase n=1 Tax=Prosthecomicrobium pneumaticum TaxID=81895 RepID=A0A7W9FK72_9HYPH|nr:peptidylprolyl isomerase [Prosthecomicrobium pneumaticum]MBB5752472.1 peptidyl-prolyl cis-trans isomerase C [Prosthecomicrobium pneumaticum]